jgi:hypothetical protein
LLACGLVTAASEWMGATYATGSRVGDTLTGFMACVNTLSLACITVMASPSSVSPRTCAVFAGPIGAMYHHLRACLWLYGSEQTDFSIRCASSLSTGVDASGAAQTSVDLYPLNMGAQSCTCPLKHHRAQLSSRSWIAAWLSGMAWKSTVFGRNQHLPGLSPVGVTNPAHIVAAVLWHWMRSF